MIRRKLVLVVVIILGAYNVICGQEKYDEKSIYTINRKYGGSADLFFVNGKIIRQYDYTPRDYLKRLYLNDKALDSLTSGLCPHKPQKTANIYYYSQ